MNNVYQSLARRCLKLFAACAVLFLFFGSHAFSQTLVGSVSIEGNFFFSTNELKNSMSLKVDKPFLQDQFSSDLRSIRAKYRDSGFLFAKIANSAFVYNSDSSYADISITIDEGVPAIFDKYA